MPPGSSIPPAGVSSVLAAQDDCNCHDNDTTDAASVIKENEMKQPSQSDEMFVEVPPVVKKRNEMCTTINDAPILLDEEDDRKPPARPSSSYLKRTTIDTINDSTIKSFLRHWSPTAPQPYKYRRLENETGCGNEPKKAAIPQRHDDVTTTATDRNVHFSPRPSGDVNTANIMTAAVAVAACATNFKYLDSKLSEDEILAKHIQEEMDAEYAAQLELGAGYDDFGEANNDVKAMAVLPPKDDNSISDLPSCEPLCSPTNRDYQPTLAATSEEKNQIIADKHLATQLQAEEEGHMDIQKTSELKDKELAKQLQAEADAFIRVQESIELDDEELARQLQEEAILDARKASEAAMSLTPAGKAWQFVERVLSLFGNDVADQTFQAVAKDDLVFMAEKMFQAQEEFRQEGKPIEVDIGFHYTTESNMSNIQTDGLLTRLEREASNITAEKFNGAAYGEGIYTADVPYSSTKYGNVGLIVARLKGTEMGSVQARKSYENGNNSIYARSGSRRILVLQYSKQCVAMVRYPTESLRSPHFQNILNELQHVVDDAFNEGRKHSAPDVQAPDNYPSSRYQLRSYARSRANVTVPRVMPLGLISALGPGVRAANPVNGGSQSAAQNANNANPNTTRPVSPDPAARAAQSSNTQGCWGKIGTSSLLTFDPIGTTSLSFTYIEKYNCTASQDDQKDIYTTHTSNSEKDCSICLSCLKDTNVATLCKCGHEFHLDCLKQALAQKETRCPVCRYPLSEPWGKMPHGTMAIKFSTSRRMGHYSGFPNDGVISIKYNILSGIQENHHPNPGQPFLGDRRVAYLPDCREGRRLLTRLVYAFMHGLTFSIGSSLTTGRSNVITWASIHHKTSLSGGVHGYPDPSYFLNCNEELDSLGVPKASD